MANKKAVMLVKGTSGRTGKIVVPGCDTIEKAEAFATTVEGACMDGKVVSASLSDLKKYSKTIDAGNTDRKGIIKYQNNVTNTVKHISIPSWGTGAGKSVMEDDGERIPKALCGNVVEAIETASGQSCTALEGWVVQSK